MTLVPTKFLPFQMKNLLLESDESLLLYWLIRFGKWVGNNLLPKRAPKQGKYFLYLAQTTLHRVGRFLPIQERLKQNLKVRRDFK